MTILEKIESTLRTMGNIDYEKVITKDNLSVYNDEYKGQTIIFVVRPKKDILHVPEMQIFLTNIHNNIGDIEPKHDHSFYAFEEINGKLALGRIDHIERIATLISGDFESMILEPGIISETSETKKDLDIVNNSRSEAIRRHIAIIFCPTKKIMSYVIENELHINAPANIPENIWRC